jgi:BirA family biotin operon repressor/biotin-[acetyl-CoA-carboxylase] ligase
VTSPVNELSLDACLDRHRQTGGRDSLAVIETADSTNRLARRIARVYLEAESLPPRLVLIARRQLASRGRHGRSWISPAGQGIYSSLLLSAASVRELHALPLRVPLALCRALEEVGVSCRIKWPNDLVIAGGKLGGVLIESIADGRAVIVGYGINGSQTADELPTIGATSLRIATGGSVDISVLAVSLAGAVMGGLAESKPLVEVIEAYRERSVHRPGDRLQCRLGDELVSGRFIDFDAMGRLRLETREGERSLGSAELLAEPDAGPLAGGRSAVGA